MNRFRAQMLWGVILIACFVGLLFVSGCDAIFPQGLMGAGVTNLTNLEVAGTMAVAGNTDLTGTLVYGGDDLYAVGYGTSGQEMIWGTESITGTLEVTTGLTTVTWALCTIGEDPASGAADHLANCTVAVSGNAVTVQVWEDDQITASTEADVIAHWMAIGTP